ncbi:MAG: glycosyltransferase family 39 protein [Patescibacteria group bacterium]
MRLKNFIGRNFCLILIVAFYFVTRLWGIIKVPASVYWDEASIGYNAYSVLTTASDEWGETLPLHFRAFSEFKLPVYIYSVAISEFVFGLTPLAVRLPAVVYGFLVVVGLYALILKLTQEKNIALIGAFFLTISPWTFIFTRTGYEAIAGLAFFIWGTYFLASSARKPNLLLVSTLCFIASFYSYNSFRILAPVILVFGMIYFLVKIIRQRNRKSFIIWIIALGIFMVSLLPLYKLYKFDSGLGRLATVGVEGKNTILAFGQNYMSHFSPKFLFISGDIIPRSQFPGNSQLFWLDTLFIFLGLVLILKKRKLSFWLILAALLIAPIPASITKESPHALRSILMAPIFSIITAFGVSYFLKLSGKYQRGFTLLILGIYIFLFGSYFYRFMNEYNQLSSDDWQYPYSKIYSQYSTVFPDYSTIYITDEYAQPYIFTLFYNKVNSRDFIAQKVLSPVADWGFSTVKSFGKFQFIKKCAGDFVANSLFFCPVGETLSGNIVKVGQIENLSGKAVLNVYHYE